MRREENHALAQGACWEGAGSMYCTVEGQRGAVGSPLESTSGAVGSRPGLALPGSVVEGTCLWASALHPSRQGVGLGAF